MKNNILNFLTGRGPFLTQMERSILAMEEEQVHIIKVLTDAKNFKLAKKTLLNLPIARRNMFLNCLRAAFSPAEAAEITNEIFEKGKTTRYSAYEIFYAAHNAGTLKSFLKK